MNKITSEWVEITVKDRPPLETPILVKHKYGVEAVQFLSGEWRYWYTGKPVEKMVLMTATYYMIAKFPKLT